jgi:ATP-binding cassette subfamily G (WHITE) protein 2 (SNQ2)
MIFRTYNYAPDQLWRDWGIVLAFFIFFMILNCIIVEYIAYGSKGKQVTLYKKSKTGIIGNKVDADSGDAQSHITEPVAQAKGLLKSTKVLTWEKLSYTVPLPGHKKLRLLDDIYGYVAPGCLTALMGSSGAG